jgi:hypothetical protein
MEETISIIVKLPKDFSLKLDRYIIDLKEKNYPTIPTKAELIAKYSQIGFLHEKNER